MDDFMNLMLNIKGGKKQKLTLAEFEKMKKKKISEGRWIDKDGQAGRTHLGLENKPDEVVKQLD
jgi:hypothetical protein